MSGLAERAQVRSHRHFIPDDLRVGWSFVSPAGRWETVTGLQEPEIPLGVVKVWTDQTGEDYNWRLPAMAPIEAHRPHASRLRDLRIVAAETYIVVVLFPAEPDEPALVRATSHANGRWLITDYPDGDIQYSNIVDDRASAMSAVRRAALRHARAINVRLTDSEPQ